jgi:membrane fusion protein, multidrug efflux system
MKRSAIVIWMMVAAVVAGGGYVTWRVLRGGGAGGVGMEGFEPTESVQIVESREVTWQPTADLVGTVFALRSVSVRNELAGVVTHVGFESGTIVEPGQVLLKQDDTTDRADIAAARASVRVAEANVANADAEIRLATRELERLTGLDSQAVAEIEIDRARSKLDSAAADRVRWVAEVDQASARVAQVEARLSKLTLVAPFRARAGMRTVHAGQYLAEGSDVVMLQEMTDTIYLDFAVAQEYVPRVVIGTTVMATGELLGPDPVPIKVVAMDASVSRDTRNLRIRSVVDNSKGTLVPGMSVQVRVPIDVPATRVVIPSMAIRRAAYANSVFVITPDEKGDGARAKQRFVKLGQTLGEDVIVLDGLKVGERVAAAGSFKLRDGVKVMIAPAGAPPTGGSPPGDASAEGGSASDDAAGRSVSAGK